MELKYFVFSTIIIILALTASAAIQNHHHMNTVFHAPEPKSIEEVEFNESKYLSHEFYQNATNISTLNVEKFSHNLIINNESSLFYDYVIYYIPYDNPEKFYYDKNYITEKNRFIIIGKKEYIPVENTTRLYLFLNWKSINDLNNFGYNSEYMWN